MPPHRRNRLMARKIIERYEQGEHWSSIAADFEICKATLHNIVNWYGRKRIKEIERNRKINRALTNRLGLARQMYEQGKDWQEIADALGYASKNSAQVNLRKAADSAGYPRPKAWNRPRKGK